MIAVLTGDLVNSTKMSDNTYKGVIKDLQRELEKANQEFGASGEIYRGDAFQVQYPEPVYALSSTLLIKLALQFSPYSVQPVQCTISLAYGQHTIYADKPNTSSGRVFVDSGRGLEKAQRGELSVSLPQHSRSPEILLLTHYLSHQLNHLTKSQAELLYQYIHSDFAEHKKIAKLTATTRQNISNRLSKIGANLVKDYIQLINTKVQRRTPEN